MNFLKMIKRGAGAGRGREGLFSCVIVIVHTCLPMTPIQAIAGVTVISLYWKTSVPLTELIHYFIAILGLGVM